MPVLKNQPHRYPLRSKMHSKGTNFRHQATQNLINQNLFQPKVHHIFKDNVKKETIDSLLNSVDKKIWTRSLSNEWGRLAKDNKYGVNGTDNIEFIHKNKSLIDKRVTYATHALDYWPLKDKKYED